MSEQLLSDKEVVALFRKHNMQFTGFDSAWGLFKDLQAAVIAAHTARLLEGVAGEVVAWMVPVSEGYAPVMTNDVEQAKNWAMSGANVIELVPDTALAAARSELAAREAEIAKANARLRWMSEHSAWVSWNREGDMCRVMVRADDPSDPEAHPVCGWGKRFSDPIEAIDAAMSGQAGEVGK